MGADFTHSSDNVCLLLIGFHFHFSFAISFRSHFRVRANLPDIDRRQSLARSDRWAQGFLVCVEVHCILLPMPEKVLIYESYMTAS
jgi:hypothetical protein